MIAYPTLLFDVISWYKNDLLVGICLFRYDIMLDNDTNYTTDDHIHILQVTRYKLTAPMSLYLTIVSRCMSYLNQVLVNDIQPGISKPKSFTT